MPDIRLKQSARFVGETRTVQISVPDVFTDWAQPGWIEPAEGAPLAPVYEVSLDWRVADSVLDESQALATAVMIALGSDRLAAVSDELPDNLSNDRRGWWGDLEAEEIWDGWPVGTRLWTMKRDALRGRGYRHGATAAKAEAFVRECIRPFVDAGIISKYTVKVEQVSGQRLDVLIVLMRTLSPDVQLRFAYLYDEIHR